nr:unnamed protein product [Digitaria exilis]
MPPALRRPTLRHSGHYGTAHGQVLAHHAYARRQPRGRRPREQQAGASRRAVFSICAWGCSSAAAPPCLGVRERGGGLEEELCPVPSWMLPVARE